MQNIIAEEIQKQEAAGAPPDIPLDQDTIPMPDLNPDTGEMIPAVKIQNSGFSGHHVSEEITDAVIAPPIVSQPRPKLKEKMEIAISPNSAICPGNVVLLGTGDLNKKYRQWLDNQFSLGLAQNNPEKKPSRERLRLQQLVHILCYMAVVEDETETVTYLWKGPKFYKKHQALNIPLVVQEFVKDKFDILYAIAPFFGVKNNRKASIDTIDVAKEETK